MGRGGVGKPKIPLPEINPNTVKYTNTFTHIPALAIVEHYNDKIPVPGSIKGKQFKGGRFHGADEQTRIASEAYTMSGNASTSLFKVAPSLFCAADKKGKEPYVDVDRLSVKFPNGDMRPKNCAKLGFGSTNFRAVDKFANTMNTERMRETLRKEVRLVNKASNENEARSGSTQGMIVPRANTLAPQKLYDVVHRQQPTSFKHARDDSQMRYVYMNQRQKELGKTPHHTFEKLHGLSTKKLHQQTNAFDEPHLETKEPTWVQVKLPTGALLNVLVDEQERIVAQNSVESSQDIF
mmetsp:Transcript_60768/g.89071  ORF Transcript_60768/g.89071 Transcript_60768/m.89071 type:complete len:294 (+) Transcript_60768:99-980(+)|eukprot:CAMPEP_0173104574 /NCGR_PEP_ID=MMETSP1102-20130122/39375_1 /TAXON_ID=49646 /ORGANISM="Geminigera sp., Strain Caron Lab Isolate" /LENGTH=293 /DNA_ID=CAMNT_0014000223 /DNA_START=90 /DNA_END=971 /DNA_ORIENTATION=+